MTKRIVSLLLVFVFVISFAACSKVRTEMEEPTSAPTTEAKEVGTKNPLTGESDFNQDYVGKRPIAVTIQNNVICRPQWGLGSADITIEAEVEGTETKYLWVYSDPHKLTKGGPFRSVRVDFVEMAMGFDAILVHCGWSYGVPYGAKELLTKTGYDHINGGDYRDNDENGIMFRSSTSPNGKQKGREYRSYTKGDSIAKVLATSKSKMRQDIKQEYAHPFSFYDEKTALPGGACNKISFKVGKHSYHFDYSDGLYYGNYGDKALKDYDGNKFAVENVIILYINSVKVMDKKGRVDMDLSGGTGVIASNGTYQNIKWTKGGAKEMFKFTDENGNELKLNVGKTYIGLARNSNAGKTVIA